MRGEYSSVEDYLTRSRMFILHMGDRNDIRFG